MPTQLENRLSHLQAPTEPSDLKNRCFDTIPVADATQSVLLQKTARPFMLQKAAVTGALMFSVVTAVAFWNTRPIGNTAATSSESVAFAQTMEEFQKVSFGHVKGRDMEAGILKKGWHASDFFRTEMWFDAGKGLYRERQNGASNSQVTLADGTSARALYLPDGTSYYRYANSSTLLITSSPHHWNSTKKAFTDLLSGRIRNQLLTSSPSQWKGQKAQLFQNESVPSDQDKKNVPGISSFHTYLYVNPNTKLPLALQSFIAQWNSAPRLVREYEFDYSPPDAKHFDPAPLKKGAVIQRGEEMETG